MACAAGARDAFARLGHQDEDFKLFLTSAPADRHGPWVLNFWTDVAANLYRHIPSGALIQVQVSHHQGKRMNKSLGKATRDLREWDPKLAGDARPIIEFMREEFEYIGWTPQDVAALNYRCIFALAPANTRVVVLMANETVFQPDGGLNPAPLSICANRPVRAVMRDFARVNAFAVDQVMEEPGDQVARQVLNLQRHVQYKIFLTIVKDYEKLSQVGASARSASGQAMAGHAWNHMALRGSFSAGHAQARTFKARAP